LEWHDNESCRFPQRQISFLVLNMPLDPQTQALFRAILDRLIPRDNFPGACDAGVDAYILRRCETDTTDCGLIRTGLAEIDAAVLKRMGRVFSELAEDDQDALLADIDAGKMENVPPGFFTRIVELAAEGFYSNPENGGNRDGVSWRMIGYDRRTPGEPTAP
jgi:hypothetical protein